MLTRLTSDFLKCNIRYNSAVKIIISVQPFYAQQHSTNYSSTTNAKHKKRLLKLKTNTRDFNNVENFPEKRLETVDISKIQSLFGIETFKAKSIVRKYPELESDISPETLDYLISKDVTLLRISNMPWLLLLNQQLIEEKVSQVMTTLKIDDFSCSVPFIDLKYEKLQNIADLWKSEFSSVKINGSIHFSQYSNRLDYISKRLKCKPVEVADMMNKVKRITHFPLAKLDTVLNILLDGGVETKDIVIDPWVLLHNQDEMKRRLDSAKQNHLKIRPWMLRCPHNQYEKFFSRASQEKLLVEGHRDLKGFLQNILGCDKEAVNDMLYRAPFIQKTSLTKLNEMVLLLYSHGFNGAQILKVPRILRHSPETIESRIQILSNFGGFHISLSVLCKTAKKYEGLLHHLNYKDSIKIPSLADEQ